LRIRRLSSDSDGESPVPEPRDLVAAGNSGALDRAVADLGEAPRRLLIDYRANRRASEVSRMLAVAARLRELVDRVVIVADGGTLAAVRAVLSSCLHPHHNELSRGARGGRPRVYFAANSIDNDALHGLLEIVSADEQQGTTPAGWALLVIDTGAKAPCAVLRLLQQRLLSSCDGDESLAAERTCSVADFAPTPGLTGAWSLFTAAALLPAAVVGIDIVRLLLGGVVVSQAFLDGAASPARELAALRRDLADAGHPRRTLITDLLALSGLQSWHDDWLAPPLDANDRRETSGATQRLVVSAARTRCDSLGLERLPSPTNANSAPTIGLELPALDEVSLGQLAQTLLLATLLERLPPG
jgi:glucose-6-phosphate isomerase